MRWTPRIALIALTAATLAACDVEINVGSARHVETRDHEFVFPPEGALEVVTTNGSVEIHRRRGLEAIKVRAEIKAASEERLDDTVIVADPLPDGTLVISVSWPGERRSGEGCSFEIDTPDVSGVRVKSGNGGISLENLSGPADLETSNGSIEVKDHDGTVEARTSNGRIDLEDVTGLIVARTSNGKIEVEDAGATVDVGTSNGRISISLDDDNAGPVKAHTSNGRVKVRVGRRFGGEVSLRTSNSSVRFDDFQGLRVLERTKHSARLAIPGAAHVSVVESSNGSVELERD